LNTVQLQFCSITHKSEIDLNKQSEKVLVRKKSELYTLQKSLMWGLKLKVVTSLWVPS